MMALVVVAFCSERIAYVRGGMMAMVFVPSTEEEAQAIRVAMVPLRVVADIIIFAANSLLHDAWRAREIVLSGRMMRR
jgi:hypothetical protein